MKKIWSYIAMFAIGLAAGIVAGVKLMGDQVEIKIRKIKTKKGSSDIDLNIDAKRPPKRLKRTKEERKADREKLKDG